MALPAIILPITGFAIFSGIWWILQRRLFMAGVPKSMVLVASGTGGLLLILLSLYWYGAPPFTPELSVLLGINILLSVIISFCYTSAIEKGEASLAVSVTAFAPVLAIVTGYWIVGESPSPLVMVGIVLILIGTYILNITPQHGEGLLGPLKKIWRERSQWLWYAVAAACASSVTIPIEKRIIAMPEYPFYLLSPGMQIFFGWAVFWGIVGLWRREQSFRAKISIPQVLGGSVLIAICLAIANASQGAAYYYGLAASVGALKRLDGPVTVLLATLFLNEKSTGYRLIGTLIIALGAFLIVALK